MSEQAATNLETLPELQARVFNRLSGKFEPVEGAVVVTLLDILTDNPRAQLEEIGPDKQVFVAMTMYDITETVRRALCQLADRRPDCFAVVFGGRSMLEYWVDARVDLKLLAATFPVPDIATETSDLKHEYATTAFAAGCDGIVVDANFDCSELAERYPDRHFIQFLDSPV